MKRTLENLKPTGIDDLSAVNALYRPGSMKYIDNYIDRMHGFEEFEYLHPDLEEVLGPTYGIIVFQEQLITIGRIAGMRSPDLLRAATAKKNPKLLAQAEPELREGLYKRGWTVEQVDQLWLDMLAFAKYSFNRSHSSAYAIIAFICAFLKAYHPLEFFTSWFNSLVGKDKEKFEVAYKEMVRLGFEFNQPTFRNTPALCQLEDGKITYGISLIKNCNAVIAEELTAFSDNKYDHFVDLLIDIKEKTTVNVTQLDILIKFGYFSEFGSVDQLLHITEEAASGVFRYNKKHKDNTKVKRRDGLIAIENDVVKGEIDTSKRTMKPYEIIAFEKDMYGFIKTKFPELDKNVAGVLDIDTKYTPKVTIYSYNTGVIMTLKVKRDKFYGKKDIEPFEIGDSIKIKGVTKRNKVRKGDEEAGEAKWIETDEEELYLEKCVKIN